jgi:hypothetical protein
VLIPLNKLVKKELNNGYCIRVTVVYRFEHDQCVSLKNLGDDWMDIMRIANGIVSGYPPDVTSRTVEPVNNPDKDMCLFYTAVRIDISKQNSASLFSIAICKFGMPLLCIQVTRNVVM